MKNKLVFLLLIFFLLLNTRVFANVNVGSATITAYLNVKPISSIAFNNNSDSSIAFNNNSENNSIVIENNLYWKDLLQGRVCKDVKSNSSRITGVVGGSSINGQSWAITAFDPEYLASCNKGFTLYDSCSGRKIEVILYSDQSPIGRGCAYRVTPFESFVSRLAAPDDSVQVSVWGVIPKGTYLAPGVYQARLVLQIRSGA